MKATIYSKPTCPYCIKAKKLLEGRGIKYKELVLGPELTKEDVSEYVGREITTVPQIIIDGTYIGGHDDLVKHFLVLGN